jgi:N-acetylneuraminic acid mutarotase
MIGKDFVILSGFKTQFDETTPETYALDVSNATAKWRRMDDAPLAAAPGFSHAAYAVVGTKVYLCGGYLGPNPGSDFFNCVVYDHSVALGTGRQWSSIADLPDGRGGAGMVYGSARNALYFASGADRAQGTTKSFDKPDTWMQKMDLEMPDISSWVVKKLRVKQTITFPKTTSGML